MKLFRSHMVETNSPGSRPEEQRLWAQKVSVGLRAPWNAALDGP